MIEQKTIDRLEFQKILDRVIDVMPSSGARKLFAGLGFSENALELAERQKNLRQAMDLSLAYAPIPYGAVYEIEEDIQRTQKGSSLDEETLIHIMDTLRSHRRLRNFFDDTKEFSQKYPRLADLTSAVQSFKALEDEIDRCIDDELRVRNSASSELSKIRRSLELANEELRRKINNFVSDSRYSDYLQESLVTMRGDRYVIPVKAEHKRKIQGAVLDSSGSGSTVYIEPIELMQIGNTIRELQAQEWEEVQRILRELSGRVGRQAEPILASQACVTWFLMLLGLSRYAHETRANVADFSEERLIRLLKARHPLLDPQTVVPMTMEFGNEASVLIITGPNTGGKTVAIKAVGIMVLMNQWGLAIPADTGSFLPFFENVYVDIGDEQSIEQSLSTFSSHMKNVVTILEKSDRGSLVLLDELGAGTDPQEGAALARSILRALKNQNAMVFATSHYNEIKQFAMTHEGYMNASVEFDIKTLSPTYKLLMGVPGSSNAFEISKKLGLPDVILEDARNSVDEADLEMEELLAELESARKDNEDMAYELKRSLNDAVSLRERYEERLRTISEQRERILNLAKEEARQLMRETESQAKDIMKELRNMSQGQIDFSKMEKQQQRLNESKQKLAKEEKIYKPKAPASLKPGDTIYVPKLEAKGTVDTAPDKDGNFKAQVGILKMSLNLQEVEKIKEEIKEVIPKVKGDRQVTTASRKLDLRGQNVEDARIEVDKFLDQALVGHLETVEIIHGKGTGVLRSFIKDYLRKHPHVKNQRFGSYHEGGDGVTIVTIK